MVYAKGGTNKRSDSALGAKEAWGAISAALEVLDWPNTFRSICVAAELDILTIIIR